MLTITKQEISRIELGDEFNYCINGRYYSMIVEGKEYKEVIKEGFSKSYTMFKEYLIGKCPETNRKRKVELTELINMNESCLTF